MSDKKLDNPIIIGTRNSHLALHQAIEVRNLLMKRFPHLSHNGLIKIKQIRTTGDRIQDRDINQIASKAVFTKEIQDALIDRKIDIAVHSLKDVMTQLPENLTISARLPRIDANDCLISCKHQNYQELLHDSIIGTSATRRKAILLDHNPQQRIVSLRGNIETRLQKIKNGQVDAAIMAFSAIKRNNIKNFHIEKFDIDFMLPAVSQGVVGIETRNDDPAFIKMMHQINHIETEITTTAERRFLHKVNGGCKSPIACNCYIKNNQIFINAEIYSLDNKQKFVSRMVEHCDLYRINQLQSKLNQNQDVSSTEEYLHFIRQAENLGDLLFQEINKEAHEVIKTFQH